MTLIGHNSKTIVISPSISCMEDFVAIVKKMDSPHFLLTTTLDNPDTSYGGYDYNTSMLVRNDLPTILANSLTLANSGVFFFLFTVMLGMMAYFVARSAGMKWNQKLLFVFVSTFAIIQILCLISRTVYNAIGINIRLIDLSEVIPDLHDRIVALMVFSFFENLFSKIQCLTVLVIQAFIIHLL